MQKSTSNQLTVDYGFKQTILFATTLLHNHYQFTNPRSVKSHQALRHNQSHKNTIKSPRHKLQKQGLENKSKVVDTFWRIQVCIYIWNGIILTYNVTSEDILTGIFF